MRLLLPLMVLVFAVAGCSGGGSTPSSGGSTVTTQLPEPVDTSLPSITLPVSSSTTQPDIVGSPPFDTWTAIVASLPVDEYDRASAEAYVRDLLAQDRRLTEVGLLLSDRYPSLRPGYWLAFSSVFDDPFFADEHCTRLKSSIPDCYVKYLGIDPEQPVGRETATALALADDGRLVVLDTLTGVVVRTIARGFFGGDGYPGPLQLSPDGSVVFYSVGFEDSWYTCESTDGTLKQMDLVNGVASQIGDGWAPRVSPDGTRVAYLAASQCLPDPEEPQFFVAFADTIVVRDIRSGDEERTELALNSEGRPKFDMWSLLWTDANGLVVIDGEWSIRDADTFEILGTLGGDGSGWNLLGTSPTGDIVHATKEIWLSAERTELELWKLNTRDSRTGLIDRYDGPAGVGLDANGNLIIGAEGMLTFDGRSVPLDIVVTDIDW